MEITRMRSLKHHGPDKIAEGILATIAQGRCMEFADIADAVMMKAYPRKPTYQSLEKLRLRVYEQLQELVKNGHVSKVGDGAKKRYSILRERA